MELLSILNNIKAVDLEYKKLATHHWNNLMKPIGSLGKMEELIIQLSSIYKKEHFSIDNRLHIVFSADNGIVKKGVSGSPKEYTKLVSLSIANGTGAISNMCKTNRVDLKVVDLGIDNNIDYDLGVINKKINFGTKDFTVEPAMDKSEMENAIAIGFEFIKDNLNYDIFSAGEMGIGNTTTSSAVLYGLLDVSVDEIVGYGSGISEEILKQKKILIQDYVKKWNSPLDLLQNYGGFDICAMVGFYIGAAYYKKPVIIDGFISSVAALIAVKLNKNIKDYMIFSHMSEEPGVKIIYDILKVKPPLNMNMRLGEGTGALLIYPIIDNALAIYKGMKTPIEIYNKYNEKNKETH